MDWKYLSENITYSKLYNTTYNEDVQNLINYFDATIGRDLMKDKLMKKHVYFREYEFNIAYLYSQDTNIFWYDINLPIYAKILFEIDNDIFDNFLTWYILEYTYNTVTSTLSPRVRKFTGRIDFKEFELELDSENLGKYIDDISKYAIEIDKIKIDMQKYKIASLNAVLEIGITNDL